MLYNPEYEENVIETVTTANKNIQSYFMRSDKSYYLNPEDTFPLCNTTLPILRIVVDNGLILLGSENVSPVTIKTDVISKNSYNSDKYATKTVCIDKLCNLIGKGFGLIKEQMSIGPEEEAVPKEMFVQLIFCDFFNRSTLIPLVDILLNQIRFKGLMTLPLSLAISLGTNTSHCAFLFESGFAFIDDFVRVDAHAPGSKAEQPGADDQDFVEEFTRLQLLDDSLKYSCDECEHKEETEAKVRQHLEKEHEEGTYFHYETNGVFEDEFTARLRYLFDKERAARIRKTLYAVGREFDGAQPLPNHYELAFQGASTLSRLESAKEMWLTGKEWQEWRLRLLKEKVLFYI